MISKIISAMPHGFDYRNITVEGDLNRSGLPCFNIVGLHARSIAESRDRIRSAVANSGFSFPNYKITINLAPANLAKSGTSLDLPIALAILTLSEQLLPADTRLSMFVGELSLNGDLRPITGIINIVEAAIATKLHALYIPAQNYAQASLAARGQIQLFPVHNLREL